MPKTNKIALGKLTGTWVVYEREVTHDSPQGREGVNFSIDLLLRWKDDCRFSEFLLLDFKYIFFTIAFLKFNIQFFYFY